MENIAKAGACVAPLGLLPVHSETYIVRWHRYTAFTWALCHDDVATDHLYMFKHSVKENMSGSRTSLGLRRLIALLSSAAY